MTRDKDARGLDVDYRFEEGRDVCEPPQLRDHKNYRKPHWATCHIDGIDKLFAAASAGGSNRDEAGPQVRVDLDGVGSGGASLHGPGENINLSFWIDRDQIDELIDLLEAARDDGRDRVWAEDAEEGDR